ncbi:hypothetical protein BT96DRAFT_924691 [Gymnopus androsaceus JB14]|uniref:Uncharacterized protein n=1 Tax=Gymnopus androsaceus JB14 TaxID=1447944 RepID=A0A6A4H3Y2_9AGAR|nr:hypothetical protein BT96DRAFT_924691 [Gymnopus androsaceus JB14]
MPEYLPYPPLHYYQLPILLRWYNKSTLSDDTLYSPFFERQLVQHCASCGPVRCAGCAA